MMSRAEISRLDAKPFNIFTCIGGQIRRETPQHSAEQQQRFTPSFLKPPPGNSWGFQAPKGDPF
jgi:hypothetical protein